jgi:PilZ domain
LWDAYSTSATVSNSPNSASPYDKQRTVPRYNFIATTELTDTANAIRLSGRITEISRNGCYVDVLNALPLGTVLNLEVSCDQGRFLAKGNIVYIHPGIGMGVAFLELPEQQLKILDSWLAGLPPSAVL